MSWSNLIVGAIVGGVAVLYAWLWGREKTKREIAELIIKQKERELQHNKKVNEEYQQKTNTQDSRVGSSVDPLNPMSGL